MAEKIEELEKTALAAKPWQLTGEVSAQMRPENSMLEEDVAFDQASRMGKRQYCSECCLAGLNLSAYFIEYYYN